MAGKKRIVDLKVLPGEPLDGAGKVCIHLFVKDDNGPFTEPHVLRLVTVAGDGESQAAGSKIEAGPARGRLACDRKRTVAVVSHNGVSVVTPRSDDPRAVTCLKCKAAPEYNALMKVLEGV